MIYIGAIIGICYLIILIWLTAGIIKSNVASDESFYPNVSIIISAHNEENKIANLLDSLIEQDYHSEYEIIIGNDRSIDSTKEIVDKYLKQHNNIRLIEIKETPIGWGHKKWSLNACIEASNYEIILQTDADCMPKPRWIKSMIDNFSDPNITFVSAAAPMSNQNNKLSEYYKLDSLAQDALSAAALSRNLSFSCTGRNIGFLKQAFFDINGYQGIEQYESGDDDLLLQKFSTLLDGKINFSFNPESVVVSSPPESMKQFINQRIRYASKGFDYYKLNTTIEFKVLLPLLYLVNLISLLGIIFFIQTTELSYLFPFFFKIIADYWICSNFFNKIDEIFLFQEFIILSILHPIYVVSLGIFSPFINYTWGNDV